MITFVLVLMALVGGVGAVWICWAGAAKSELRSGGALIGTALAILLVALAIATMAEAAAG